MGLADRLTKVDATLVRLLGLLGQTASPESSTTDDKVLFTACEGKIVELQKAVKTTHGKESGYARQGSAVGRLSTACSAPNPNLLNPADLLSSGVLEAHMQGLKKVTTRDRLGCNEAEVSSVAGIYERNKGDFAAISKECGADMGLLRKTPPKNSLDFADKLLLGFYTKAGDAVSIKLGPPSAHMLINAGKGLRKVTTNMRSQKAAAAELNIMAAIFNKGNGDLEKIAAMTGSSIGLMKRSPPTDGLDFASKLLSGAYTDVFSDAGPAPAVPEGQESLEAPSFSVEDIRNCAGKLKKVTSKIGNSFADPADNDVTALAKLWDQNKGDMEVLTDICCISYALLKTASPKDGRIFAKDMLAGRYTDGHSEALRKKFQGNAMSEALAKQGQKLKRTVTSEKMGQVSENELLAVGKIYDDHNGDLQKLAALCQIPYDVMRLNKPADAMDFAKKVLSGKYSSDKVALPRDPLKRPGKATAAETSSDGPAVMPSPSAPPEPVEVVEEVYEEPSFVLDGEPTPAEIAIVARIWTANGGNLKEIFEICDIDFSVRRAIIKNPPKSAEDFARRFLRGDFNPDW